MIIYHAITTCNGEQWRQYGRAMAATFARHWPEEVGLTVYAEGFWGETNGRVRYVDLNQAAPWLVPWKAARTPEQRGITKDGYKYRWDAAKFVHKVAALGAASNSLCDVLIWLDADLVTHSPVTTKWLDSLFPLYADMAWLDREKYYPECGFMMFRLPQCATLINAIVAMYVTDAVFRLQQFHDSFVIETIVKAAEAQGEVTVASLSGAGRAHHHVLPNSPLAICLDHLKGKRKELGRTPRHERRVPGGGSYWT